METIGTNKTTKNYINYIILCYIMYYACDCQLII